MTPDHADDYRPHLGTAFAVEGWACSLVLEAIDPFETGVSEGFSLCFTGPREVLVPQGTHPLQHPVLGSLTLFLVPVQSRQTGVHTYEAIFNRLRPAAQAPRAGGA